MFHLALNDFACFFDLAFMQSGQTKNAGGGANRRKRVAQLMGKHGEKFILTAIRLLQLYLALLSLRDIAGGTNPFNYLPMFVEHGDRP